MRLHQLRLRYIFVFHNGKGASLFLVRQQGVSGEDTYEVTRAEQSNYRANDFEKHIRAGSINLYITGGCTKKEMIEKGYQKSMQQNKTQYKVVKLINGFDAIEFKNEMIKKMITEPQIKQI